MSSRAPTSLLLLQLLLSLLLLQVSLINSLRQETKDLAKQTQVESHRPLRRYKRRWVVTTLELQEEDTGPFPKFVGELFNNMSVNMALMYLISGPGVDRYPEIGLFSIEDHENGKVYVHRPVDRETTPSFKVYFDVVNRLTGEYVDNSLIFNIRITDVNDHAPQFPENELNVSVRESHAAGQPVLQLLTVDLDEENTPNSRVLYFLVSQKPLLKESGFEIDRDSGEIRLLGCLDYETAPRFTLLIRARDCGEPPLSATATVHISVQEGNNHRPTFIQENYKIQVPEGRVSPDVLRLPVQDDDSPFTSAWRAKFNISNGNEEGHFDISTDPETNEGILNVIKALDYETHPACSLVIAVENEELLVPCEAGELQKPRRETAASATVLVQVTDANNPPAFHPRSFVVSEVEGARPGTRLGRFNATDPDGSGSQIRYELAHDPASWVTVDERSGVVVTRQRLDRESPHVNNGVYVVIAHAVDEGHPPQTGTGTLTLLLSDINDNAPSLHPRSRYLEVCESSEPEPLLIEAEDGDLEPSSDPFTFELDTTQGHAGDTWKLGENRGRSVELLMLRSLPPGDYSVPLSIGDGQGLSQKQTVHVRVCSCPGGATCAAEPLAAGPELPVGVLAPLCVVFLALAVALLLLLRCDCVSGAKRHRCPALHQEGQQTLITYNDESRAIAGQPCVSQIGSEVRNQKPALPTHTAEEGAALGAKVYLGTGVPRQPLEVRAGVMAEILHQVEASPCRRPHPGPAGGASPKPLSLSAGAAATIDRGLHRPASHSPGTQKQQMRLLTPRGSMCCCRKAGAQPRGSGSAEEYVKKLCGLHALAADPGSLPHIYMEEGELEGAESLSSLAFSEHTLSLPNLLDWLGPRPEETHPRASPKSARHYGPLN
ncbi:PREDICTED: cadherin-like protein 26 [Myotis brandtii]|uniref:cadherin-like protein 26 n=1 Tax=Myotis brandtii TaxID=109478 RepID=UPI0007042F15|nr:PREDICTED: cadherin-like protein 26 [Myotis brandtii]